MEAGDRGQVGHNAWRPCVKTRGPATRLDKGPMGSGAERENATTLALMEGRSALVKRKIQNEVG